MAVTKISSIRKSINDAITYITNPNKTDEGYYISSYGCTPQTADIEFEITANEGTNRGNVKGYHIIQSFVPGEVDAATASDIGYKLAMAYTGGSHEFVVSTHIDKDHIHNHIVFNSVSFTDGKKFRNNKTTFKQMQYLNDKLCTEHGLSVIDKTQSGKGKTYYEYLDKPEKRTHREDLMIAIDTAIPLVDSFDELLKMLTRFGFEYKVNDDNYSFKKTDQERYMRLKSLGENYTLDMIKYRIEHKEVNELIIRKPKQRVGLIPDTYKVIVKHKSEAYYQQIHLNHIKSICETYNFLQTYNINSVSKIKETQNEWAQRSKDERANIRDMEDEINKLKKITTALEKRDKYKKIYDEYKKRNKSSLFFDKYESEIKLYEAAINTLKEYDVEPLATLEEVTNKLDTLTKEHDAKLKSFHLLNKEISRLDKASQNLNTILYAAKQKNLEPEKIRFVSLDR